MNEGRLIDANEIGNREIVLAKCGWLSLICIVCPVEGSFEYKVTSNEETIHETRILQSAVRKYNELVQ